MQSFGNVVAFTGFTWKGVARGAHLSKTCTFCARLNKRCGVSTRFIASSHGSICVNVHVTTCLDRLYTVRSSGTAGRSRLRPTSCAPFSRGCAPCHPSTAPREHVTCWNTNTASTVRLEASDAWVVSVSPCPSRCALLCLSVDVPAPHAMMQVNPPTR